MSYIEICLPPVVTVGGSDVVAFVIWQRSYSRHPLDPSVILPLFLLTVVALLGVALLISGYLLHVRDGYTQAGSTEGGTISQLTSHPSRLLDPITQDACAFYEDHGLFDDYTGVVYETSEGDRIAKALGVEAQDLVEGGESAELKVGAILGSGGNCGPASRIGAVRPRCTG